MIIAEFSWESTFGYELDQDINSKIRWKKNLLDGAIFEDEENKPSTQLS